MKMVLVGFAAVALLPSAAAQTVGIVTQVKGKVSLIAPAPAAGAAARPKAPARAAMLADVLSEGGEISTGADGSAAFLYCPRSAAVSMGPNSRVVFRGGQMETSGSVTSTPVKYCFVPQAAVTEASAQQVGGTRMRAGGDGVRILSPGPRTRTLPIPVFAWTGVEGADAYALAVETRDGRRLWNTKVRSTAVELPSEHALAPGESFRLRVMAIKGEEELAAASLVFRVLPAEEAQVYSEKVKHFRLAAREQPGDAAPHLQLALIYEELRDVGAAILAYEEALRFGRSEFIQARLDALRR